MNDKRPFFVVFFSYIFRCCCCSAFYPHEKKQLLFLGHQNSYSSEVCSFNVFGVVGLIMQEHTHTLPLSLSRKKLQTIYSKKQENTRPHEKNQVFRSDINFSLSLSLVGNYSLSALITFILKINFKIFHNTNETLEERKRASRLITGAKHTRWHTHETERPQITSILELTISFFLDQFPSMEHGHQFNVPLDSLADSSINFLAHDSKVETNK